MRPAAPARTSPAAPNPSRSIPATGAGRGGGRDQAAEAGRVGLVAALARVRAGRGVGRLARAVVAVPGAVPGLAVVAGVLAGFLGDVVLGARHVPVPVPVALDVRAGGGAVVGVVGVRVAAGDDRGVVDAAGVRRVAGEGDHEVVLDRQRTLPAGQRLLRERA